MIINTTLLRLKNLFYIRTNLSQISYYMKIILMEKIANLFFTKIKSNFKYRCKIDMVIYLEF